MVKRKQKSPKQRNTLTQSFAPPKPSDSPSSSSALDLPSNVIDELQYDFDSPVSSASEESGKTPKTEHKAATSTETVSRPPSGSLSRSKEDIPEAEGSPADGAVARRPSESAPPPGDVVSDSESDCSGYIDIQTPPVSKQPTHTISSPSPTELADCAFVDPVADVSHDNKAASPLHFRHKDRLSTRPSPAVSRLSPTASRPSPTASRTSPAASRPYPTASRTSPAASRLSAVKLGSPEVVEVLQEVTNVVSSSSSGQSIASSNSDLTLEPTTGKPC